MRFIEEKSDDIHHSSIPLDSFFDILHTDWFKRMINMWQYIPECLDIISMFLKCLQFESRSHRDKEQSTTE
jgi:hypothetical protein